MQDSSSASAVTAAAPAAPAKTGLPAARSMTGFGRAATENGRRVTAEIRSVNGRFLKLGVKVLGRYGALEEKVKLVVNEAGIKRGSVDVTLFFDGSADENQLGIDEDAVKAYAKQARAIAKRNKLKGKISLAMILPLPGVVRRPDPDDDLDAAWELAKASLNEAILAFNLMREKEGSAIVADIRGHLANLAARRADITALAPECVKLAAQRYKDRVARLLENAQVSAPLNPDVLEREVLLLADKTDISEELARLGSHFQQMDATLSGGGETGKKLDFLTQELFRETNTIGSKTQDERITHAVIEMKGLIEKIREQVQNLE